MSSGETETTIQSFDLLAQDRRILRRIVGRRALRAAALLGLAAAGARRGGVIGWMGAGLGLVVVARNVLAWLDDRPEWRKRPRLDLRRLLSKGPGDPVDRASSYSFPASDVPTH